MMKLIKRISAIILFLIDCQAFTASAQPSFKYQAQLGKIDSSGFYRIPLSPAFVARSNYGLSDVRIIDKAGKFVPYISADNLPVANSDIFLPFIPVSGEPDTGTTFILRRTVSQATGRLWLRLKNTAVKRTINLSGSDDLKKWFAIEENIPLQEAVRNNDGSYMQSISFPASNFRYLKLLVNDRNKTPIKFLEAGIYANHSEQPQYEPITGLSFTRSDSGSMTVIHVRLTDNYLLGMLRLNITAPKYYKRNISVFTIGSKGKQLIHTDELNSADRHPILLNAKTNRLDLQIDNGDNSPLEIADIIAAQADQSVTAYLQNGNTYMLLTGDKYAQKPTYDLKFFTDSIKERLPMINPGKVEKNTLQAPQSGTQKHDYTLLIWIVIIVALLLLIFLTVKMTTEINKTKSSQ
ncbi:MAG TPA: hypothetical protein VHA56_01160 [Mucilaginibacter sp.]|nr:hypothetical protein [Mucilaginibacter sp.]